MMTETALISTPLSDAGARRRRVDARPQSTDFSYASAAASLERQAAQSLKAHGATPGADAGRAAPSARTSAEARSQTAEPLQAAPDAAPTAAPRDASAAEKPAAASSSAAANAFAAAPQPALAATAPQAPASTIAKSGDGVAAREQSAFRAKAAPRPLAQAPASSALRETFSEILARRLEKSSVFDIRLDPPELGRVEGRLTVGDDGKSVLTLAFDNQNAFDLFSRDEQALRQALTGAGLSFGERDVAFSFRDRTRDDQAFTVADGEPAGRYEPLFRADWSTGALDIRI